MMELLPVHLFLHPKIATATLYDALLITLQACCRQDGACEELYENEAPSGQLSLERFPLQPLQSRIDFLLNDTRIFNLLDAYSGMVPFPLDNNYLTALASTQVWYPAPNSCYTENNG